MVSHRLVFPVLEIYGSGVMLYILCVSSFPLQQTVCGGFLLLYEVDFLKLVYPFTQTLRVCLFVVILIDIWFIFSF